MPVLKRESKKIAIDILREKMKSCDDNRRQYSTMRARVIIPSMTLNLAISGYFYTSGDFISSIINFVAFLTVILYINRHYLVLVNVYIVMSADIEDLIEYNFFTIDNDDEDAKIYTDYLEFEINREDKSLAKSDLITYLMMIVVVWILIAAGTYYMFPEMHNTAHSKLDDIVNFIRGEFSMSRIPANNS